MEDMKLPNSCSCNKDNMNVDTENSSLKSIQRDQMNLGVDSKESCNSIERVDLESFGGESSSRKKDATSLPDSQTISIFDSSLCREPSSTDNNKTLVNCRKSVEFDDCKVGADHIMDGCSSERGILKKEQEHVPSIETSIRTDSAQSETVQSLSKSNSFDKLYLDLIQNQLSSLKDSVQALTDAFYGKQEKKAEQDSSVPNDIANCLVENFSLLLKENQSLSRRFDQIEKALSESLKIEKENCELTVKAHNPIAKISLENLDNHQTMASIPLNHLVMEDCITNAKTKADAFEPNVAQGQNVHDDNVHNSNRFSEIPITKLQQYFDVPSTQLHLISKKEEIFNSKTLTSDSLDEGWSDPCGLFNQSDEVPVSDCEPPNYKDDVKHTIENIIPVKSCLQEKLRCPSLEKPSQSRFNNSADHEQFIGVENGKKPLTSDGDFMFAKHACFGNNGDKVNTNRAERYHKFTANYPMMCKVDEMIGDHNKFKGYDAVDSRPAGVERELRNNAADSTSALYRSFMNNSTNRFSMGGNNTCLQNEISCGKDVASFRHIFFNEECDKRFSPFERFSTSWKSGDKTSGALSSGAMKDRKSDNRQQTMFSFLNNSNKQLTSLNRDMVCDSVVMDLKSNGGFHWRMNNKVCDTENASSRNEYRSSSSHPQHETEVKCYDFLPNVLRSSSHKSKLSNLTHSCAEFWDSNSKGKDSNLPKSLKNYFLSGADCQPSTDPCSSFHLDFKDHQPSPKLKKLNNANLNFDHSCPSPLDLFQDKLTTSNIHRSTEHGQVAGASNFKMINVDLDRKCKQTEGNSPSSRFRICQGDINDPCHHGTTENVLLELHGNDQEISKVVNGGQNIKNASPHKLSVTWSPQHSVEGGIESSLTNGKRFLERLKMTNSCYKLSDNNDSDSQARKNKKNLTERKLYQLTGSRDFQSSLCDPNSICANEGSIVREDIESDNERNCLQGTKHSMAKQNTVNIVFNDGVRPENGGQLNTTEEPHKKVKSEVTETKSQHSMKNCHNVKKTNNINVNFSNNCSECTDYDRTDEESIATANFSGKFDDKYSINDNHFLSLKEANEFECGDQASTISCNDEHYDISQFSSGPTEDYVRAMTETGDAQGYDSRTEWDLMNANSLSDDNIRIYDTRITDSLEKVYKEVSSFISANENRTKYLSELFMNLKRLDSEDLRLKAVSALNSIIAEQLSEDYQLFSEVNNNPQATKEDAKLDEQGPTENIKQGCIEIENWDIMSPNNSEAEMLKTHRDYEEMQYIIKSKSQPTAGFRPEECKSLVQSEDSKSDDDYDDESSDDDDHDTKNTSQEAIPSAGCETKFNSVSEQTTSMEITSNTRESLSISVNSKEKSLMLDANIVEDNKNVDKNSSNEYVQSVFDIVQKKHISVHSMNGSSFDEFIEKIRKPEKIKKVPSIKENSEEDDEDDEDDDDDDDDDDDETVEDTSDVDVDDKEVDDDDDDDEDDDDDDEEDDDDDDEDDEEDKESDDEDSDDVDESCSVKKQGKVLKPKQSSIVESDESKSSTKISTSSAASSSSEEDTDNDSDGDDEDDDDEDEKKENDDEDDEDDEDTDDDDSNIVLKDGGDGDGDGADIRIKKKNEKLKTPTTINEQERPNNTNNGDEDDEDDDDDCDEGSATNINNDCKDFEDIDEDLIKGISDTSYCEYDNYDEEDFKQMYSCHHVDGRHNIPSHYNDEDCFGEEEDVKDNDESSVRKQSLSCRDIEMQIFKVDNKQDEENDTAMRDITCCLFNNNNKEGESSRIEEDDISENMFYLEDENKNLKCSLSQITSDKEALESDDKSEEYYAEGGNDSVSHCDSDMVTCRRSCSWEEPNSKSPLIINYFSDPECKGLPRFNLQSLHEGFIEDGTDYEAFSGEKTFEDDYVEGKEREKEDDSGIGGWTCDPTRNNGRNDKPENCNNKSDKVGEEVNCDDNDDIIHENALEIHLCHPDEFDKQIKTSDKVIDGKQSTKTYFPTQARSTNSNVNSIPLSDAIKRYKGQQSFRNSQDIIEGAKRMFGIEPGNSRRSSDFYSMKHSEHIVRSKRNKRTTRSNIAGNLEPTNLYVDPIGRLDSGTKVARHSMNFQLYNQSKRKSDAPSIFSRKRRLSLTRVMNCSSSKPKSDYFHHKDEIDDSEDDSNSLIAEEIYNENSNKGRSSDEDNSLLTNFLKL